MGACVYPVSVRRMCHRGLCSIRNHYSFEMGTWLAFSMTDFDCDTFGWLFT